MLQLTPAEISAYGAIIIAILVPIGNLALTKYKNNFALTDKEFDDGVEIRKELRKENDRLNMALQTKDDYYRAELAKKDEVINRLRDEKYAVEIKLVTAQASLTDALEKIQEFKDRVVVQGQKLAEQIKSNQQSNA